MGAMDLQFESTAVQHGQAKLNVEEHALVSLLSDENYTAEKIEDVDSDDYERLEKGIMQYGCAHYRRRCRIRAPCCNEIFDCRHCHNEAKNSIEVDAVKRHELPRHEVQQVICSLCGTEQEVREVCINCGVCMGKYFCEVCKLFDDDNRWQGEFLSLLQMWMLLFCSVEEQSCYLFESTNGVSVLPCGHTIHVKCLQEMEEHCQFACPLCSKSVCDMSKAWERLDEELATVSDSCDNKMVHILCNDCGATSEVQFHLIAHKCQKCKSYNTRKI
uniref:CHY-type domain-containing protein n=1 Tax=Leersia perrieri TaxID=77586 RepID=A0A0D9V503_9ORYZ